MLLTFDQLQLIRRHLNARIRPPEIARRTGLAVATILRIASDRKLRRRKLELLSELDLPEDDAPPEYVAARLRRCPGCGGMVYQWPCLACQLRGGDGVGECESARVGACEAEALPAACGVTF